MEIRIRRSRILPVTLLDMAIRANLDVSKSINVNISIYVGDDLVCTLIDGDIRWNTEVVSKNSSYSMVMENFE